MGEWLKYCKIKGLGVTVGDIGIPGCAYVDDTTPLSYSIGAMVETKCFREQSSDKWGFAWQRPKDQYTIRGNRKGAALESARMTAMGLITTDLTVVLGEKIMGWNPDRCPKHVEEVLVKC